jgi:hypothetical protein
MGQAFTAAWCVRALAAGDLPVSLLLPPPWSSTSSHSSQLLPSIAGSVGIAILLRIAIVVKVLSDFRRNLMVRHPINGFNAHDVSVEVVFVESLLQFPLGLTGAEYQNGLCIANTRNDRIVVDIELSRKLSLAAIIGPYLLSFMGTFKRRITRAAELPFHLGYDQSYLFPFVRDSHNNGLLMINPQTDFRSHGFLLYTSFCRRRYVTRRSQTFRKW